MTAVAIKEITKDKINVAFNENEWDFLQDDTGEMMFCRNLNHMNDEEIWNEMQKYDSFDNIKYKGKVLLIIGVRLSKYSKTKVLYLDVCGF